MIPAPDTEQRLARFVLETIAYREKKRAPLLAVDTIHELQRAHWHAGNGYLDILHEARRLGLVAPEAKPT